ncbi:bifunctional (p)ppGpp synthetase/guanosine-3',5'-bis(diphosphate) 3'-pyrophosphohydrolase [Lactobacillus sp. PV037]|uniref:RelA/SpoT family protein n=1 Tax=Lactobacillus sp. PV037 TaxID=2594496 RepID=UPI0022407B99|nr:bifunctional (p)ppGpp synthetase/guanosine-3',5'-bis(diphosphate) 3'-pyrophosphohydrolase [Lactobacillus sp. PV037]QNQ83720.1 bifunctional (p)ppGpp synthetase/guanosine-3',5'-bis(diphosphate) 3'-pyrophosphohydrolase [Lactobacillus sp. PV037]
MSKYQEMTHEEVYEECKKYMNKEHLEFVEKAYQFAKAAHENQYRASGQPYIIHPTQVAGTLATLRLDPDTVAAGYLHDTVEDTPVTNEEIKEKFGKDVAFIVDGVTKLSKIPYKSRSHEEYLADNHRKMMIAMAKDLRVIMVKLADRLHNMHTLDHLRPDKQRRIADETLDIYAPLADRLGIGTVKWELEDMSLHYLNPQQYYRIVNLMQSKRSQREKYIADAISVLEKNLDDLGIKYEISGRPKHIYSIYKKMVNKHKDFSDIYDLLAVRVIVKSIKDCYAVLGAVHTKWKPIPGRFKDYIAVPKANGYQSLHTTIIGPGGKPLEIQIRTEEMHRIAEFGVAAHWAYKEGLQEAEQNDVNKKLNMFQEILELKDETVDSEEFMKSVKTDLFSDRVYVFTPKGDVYELPKGSSPLDFAYLIHSEVGSHSVGARINGKIVPLDYQLKTGDVVEMLTQANAQPSRDWVNLVKTSRAKNKIRRFFKAQDREENIEKGKKLIEEELTNRGFLAKDFLDKEHLAKVFDHFNAKDEDDLFGAIGYGEVSVLTLANRLTEDVRKAQEDKKKQELEEKIMNTGQQSVNQETPSPNNVMRLKHNNGVMVQGVSDLMLHLAKCCNPVPGDPIIGYVTMGRGVTVHRTDCPNVTEKAREAGRLIDVAWENIAKNNKNESYNADIEIYGYNRSKLLSDVITALNTKTQNIVNISGKVDNNNMAHIYATVSVRDAAHLEDILVRMRDIPNVYEAKRSNN